MSLLFCAKTNSFSVDSMDITDNKVKAVLKSATDFIPASKSLESFNNTFIESNKTKPHYLVCGLRARQHLDSSSVSKSQGKLLSILGLRGTTLRDAVECVDLLKEWKSSDDVIEKFKTGARNTWPEASVFEEVTL
jgi:hypothetical protein